MGYPPAEYARTGGRGSHLKPLSSAKDIKSFYFNRIDRCDRLYCLLIRVNHDIGRFVTALPNCLKTPEPPRIQGSQMTDFIVGNQERFASPAFRFIPVPLPAMTWAA